MPLFRTAPVSWSRLRRKSRQTPKSNFRCGLTTNAAKLALSVPAEIYLNVAISGLLTGLVYGLMALGLSVIFGVVRVVNFAHGEMMTVAMYLAVVLFAHLGLDPLIMMLPIAAVLFCVGYVMQLVVINPFISRPEHSQFMLMVAF